MTRSAELVSRLRTFCASGHYLFWPDAVSLRDETMFDQAVVAGHRQLTDVYLLGLATQQAGRLVTFDRTIPIAAVVGADASVFTVVTAD